MIIHRHHTYIRMRLFALMMLAGAGGLHGGPRAFAQGPRRPNVLLLFTDDQRADTIGAWGNAHIRTPNLDRLVGRGCS